MQGPSAVRFVCTEQALCLSGPHADPGWETCDLAVQGLQGGAKGAQQFQDIELMPGHKRAGRVVPETRVALDP